MGNFLVMVSSTLGLNVFIYEVLAREDNAAKAAAWAIFARDNHVTVEEKENWYVEAYQQNLSGQAHLVYHFMKEG